MQRSTITVIILVVVIGGAALGWYLTKNTTTTNSNSKNINQAANAEVAEIVSEQGAMEVNRETLYNTLDIAITTASIDTEFHNRTAAEGNQYVVLFYKTAELGGVASSLASWAYHDVSLVASDGNSYSLFETKSEQSDVTGVKTGYLWYEGSDQASGFTLRFGEGENAQDIDLGF